MTSSLSRRFQRRFRRLPTAIQQRALEKLALWQKDPFYPSLHFKKVSPNRPLWSIRVSGDYRILGLREGDHIEWNWIGTHNEYDNLI